MGLRGFLLVLWMRLVRIRLSRLCRLMSLGLVTLSLVVFGILRRLIRLMNNLSVLR